MLVRTVASHQLVVFVSDEAKQTGVAPGMTLAEAGALCAGLTHQEHDPQKDLQALHRLARWMVRFSPVVAVEPPDALFLDLTGSERLFRGIDQLAQMIHSALTNLRLHFQMAIAETPGMAWALASVSQNKYEHPTSNIQHPTSREIPKPPSSLLRCSMLDVGCSMFVFSSSEELSTFAELPISSLRLDLDQILAFHALGIETIGQLMSLPRQTLPARFGQHVLHRLDQALGKIPEPLVPIPHSQPIHAKIEFEGGVESLADLWLAFKHLLEQIVHELRQRSCGARQLVAEFHQAGQPPIVKTIALSRPTANLATLWNLLRCTTETVQCGQDGFSGLKLRVPLFSRLSPEQLHLLDQQSHIAGEELDHLIERLRVRIGEHAVLFPQLVESHLPELSVVSCPLSVVSGKTTDVHCSTFKKEKDEHPTSNIEHPTSKAISRASSSSLGCSMLDVGCSMFLRIPPQDKPIPPIRPRPLHLLPTPIEIHCSSLSGELDQRQPISFTHAGQVHPLVHCNGPERITGSWWEGRNKTRDYFEVEDRAGCRFWIFRVEETRKWYLHGAQS